MQRHDDLSINPKHDVGKENDSETEEGDREIEGGGTDDSTYETENEPTTETESEEDNDGDFNKCQLKRLV